LSLEAVPILTYHSLDGGGSLISTSPERFREQMQSLAEQGRTGLSLSALIDIWDHRLAAPPKPVVVTFDDGFSNFAEHAAPILREFGFGATVFVVANYCGKMSNWPGAPPQAPVLPLMDWPALRGLVGHGFEVGSHTLTHRPLAYLSDAEAEHELRASGETIADRLGCRVRSLAYPYGLARPRDRATAGRYYEAAGSVELRWARPRDDRCWLPRVDMHYFRSPRWTRSVGTPWGRRYLAVRRAGSIVRCTLEACGIVAPVTPVATPTNR